MVSSSEKRKSSVFGLHMVLCCHIRNETVIFTIRLFLRIQSKIESSDKRIFKYTLRCVCRFELFMVLCYSMFVVFYTLNCVYFVFL